MGWWCPMAGVGPSRQWSSKKDFRPRRKEPTRGDIRAPIMGGRRGLMSYGVNLADLDRRTATYVDKILKCAKPADLPVQQPTKFEFIINLNAAKQIGLSI